jgi:hypothetical protein
MAPREVQAPPQSAETAPVVPEVTPDRLCGSEPGPLVLVLGYLTPEEADRAAAVEVADVGGTATRIGWGVVLPRGPFGLKFDTWLHVYATTQPTALTAALTALEAT